MSRLHSTRRAFGEQNLPLQALLGLLSATEAVERLLPSAGAGPAAPSAPPDRFTSLLLGLVSFRRTLLTVLGSARSEHAAREESTPSPRSLRDLLR